MKPCVACSKKQAQAVAEAVVVPPRSERSLCLADGVRARFVRGKTRSAASGGLLRRSLEGTARSRERATARSAGQGPPRRLRISATGNGQSVSGLLSAHRLAACRGHAAANLPRSEERRVGKECRS